MENCIFCKIANKQISSEVVYETDEVMAFRDVSPVAPTHILIIPKTHIPALQNLDDEQRKELTPGIFSVINELVMKEGLAEKGFRVVINSGKDGGQTVDHLHFHLLGGRDLQWPPG
jgi:histidine triad (HIT) family protein